MPNPRPGAAASHCMQVGAALCFLLLHIRLDPRPEPKLGNSNLHGQPSSTASPREHQ